MRNWMLAGLVGVAFVSGGAAEASPIFNFQFDNSGGGPDGTIGSPIVGTGSFTAPIDLAPGQYALSALSGFSLQFTFGSDLFTTADIVTPISEVAVQITDDGAQERLVFTENGTGDTGPLGGSLDLVNGLNDALSFEPTSNGGHNLYVEGNSSTANFGNYLALSGTTPVPEPSSLPVAGLGVVSLILIRLTLRRQKGKKELLDRN